MIFLEPIKKYAVFSGRATRKEYWLFVLFCMVVGFILGIVDGMSGTFDWEPGLGLFSALFSLAMLLPSIAVSVRRLHDTNRSGWMLLIAFIPFVGFVWLIILYCFKSDQNDNRFGPNPLGINGDIVSS